MPRIHVCSLARLHETARVTGAGSMVTLINPDFPVEPPASIPATRRLRLSLADVDRPVEEHVAPAESHARDLIAFARAWDRREPLLIHCFAGVSRSTAAAMIVVCALAPHRDEAEVAGALRRASPTATPNLLLVDHADRLLAREGRMVTAARAIGRGEECFEGEPFALEID